MIVIDDAIIKAKEEDKPTIIQVATTIGKDSSLADSNKSHSGCFDKEEISKIKDNIINKYPTLISKILNSDSIKVVLNKPKNITCEYIICDNKELQNLFLEISDKLID